MPTTLNLQDVAIANGKVTDAHFGLNFVSDYEKIGTNGWEKFDNIVNQIDVNSLRYPGGSTAETLFDYRNPNRSTVVNDAGETLQMETLDEYISFCNREGINPTIIVPTNCLLTTGTIDGHRTFDAAQAHDLRYFIESTLSKVDPNLTVSFELGNEYESYMTSTEYGRVANALVGIIGEAYDHLTQKEDYQTTPSEPNIFVQVWGYSVGGATSIQELAERNQQVLDQFDTENLLDVDGLVSHYYFAEGRNAGTDQAQTFLSISDQVSMISEMHRLWELACNKEMISRISEWNVLFRSETNLGLQQIDPIMEMFTSFLRSGFDALDFWSAQYHATSLADSSGRLMAAGALMDVLKPVVVGTDVGSTVRGTDLTAYTFMGSGRFVSVITSTTQEVVDLDVSSSLFPPGYRLVDAYSLGVDEATSDGKYRSLVGLPSYGEPDAKVLITQVPISLIKGETELHTFAAFESLVLVFTLDIPGRSFVYGTDGADWIYATDAASVYVGGAGIDTLLYTNSSGALNLNLGISATDPSNDGDVLISIERVIGSGFDDTILGSGDNNFIDGWLGDDIMYGIDGADTLSGGGGNDTIYGGSGNDSIKGGTEDDLILPGGGLDTVAGEAGIDTLSFIDYESGVTVRIDRGLAEAATNTVKFSGIEAFVGTLFDDSFSLGSFDSTIDGLDGDDSFEVAMGGNHLILAGNGDDFVFVFDGSVDVFGGAGDDTVISYASGLSVVGGNGDDWVFSRGDRGVFEGQEGDDVFYAYGRQDEFIFASGSDHDVIYGFRAEEDIIRLVGSGVEQPRLVWTQSGTQLYFDDNDSVLLVGCFIGSLDDLNFLYG